MNRNIILALIACVAVGFLVYDVSQRQKSSQEGTLLSQTSESVERTGSDLLNNTQEMAADVTEQAAEKIKEAKAEVAETVEQAAVKVEEAKAELTDTADQAMGEMEAAKADISATADQAASDVEEVAAEATDVNARVKDLIAKAQDFVDSGEYREAIDTANFILSNLDSDSVEAKNIRSLAKARIQGEAQETNQ